MFNTHTITKNINKSIKSTYIINVSVCKNVVLMERTRSESALRCEKLRE